VNGNQVKRSPARPPPPEGEGPKALGAVDYTSEVRRGGRPSVVSRRRETYELGGRGPSEQAGPREGSHGLKKSFLPQAAPIHGRGEKPSEGGAYGAG
jgi:hypothetical protein